MAHEPTVWKMSNLRGNCMLCGRSGEGLHEHEVVGVQKAWGCYEPCYRQDPEAFMDIAESAPCCHNDILVRSLSGAVLEWLPDQIPVGQFWTYERKTKTTKKFQLTPRGIIELEDK